MIKNIFLPEKINNYYLFSARIAGIVINATHIHATQLLAKGRTFFIEKSIQETIETDSNATSSERVIATLKKIKEQLDTCDEIRTVLPSNMVIFKELKLPFYEYENIKMVINFEVEPLLPFATKDAVIDFIITKQIPEEQSSEVLVAAVQKKQIAEHLELFKQAGIEPTAITVDLFSLFGLYQQISSYKQLAGSTFLLGIDLHTTHIGFIYNNQLRSIRTLNKGISSVVKTATEELGLSPRDVMDHLMRFGLTSTDKPSITDALTKAMASFLSEVQFTINSFAAQAVQTQAINPLLLFGDGALIKDFPHFIQETIHTPATLFSVQELIDSKIVATSGSRTIQLDALSFSAALPSAITSEFNLIKDEFRSTATPLLIKQLTAVGVLTLVSLGTLLTFSVLDSRKMQVEATDSEQEAIELLRERFPQKIESDEPSLENAIDIASDALQNEERTWLAFSGQSRTSFLKYWLELTNRIDKDALGFVIESLSISGGVMTLKAHVRDYEALKILERELRQAKLFTYVEPQTSPIFSMKIVLARNGEGA
jgi:type IV pilus assembly protein PilM